ncbi:hypothetical protein Q7C36_002170 [Tachysurus vachellii]|uniref:Alpha-tectorin-like n=1 Tax=Tachysurus vachellii TaxID=175792 RepID=A0AA88NXP7_TACVA|nr:alpha-tectorin-like isoform X1 [Tachysurus vachellii]KAK2866114.1 hypothetical protein Q7C36_002170 [Tachysurus vachellii]
MGCPFLLCLAALLFMSEVATRHTTETMDIQSQTVHQELATLPPGPYIPGHFYPFSHGSEVDLFDNIEGSPQITLQQAFPFFGSYKATIYANKNGVLSFAKPLTKSSPHPHTGTDIIAPLWTDYKADNHERVVYEEVTSGPLLFQATHDINTMFPENNFYATWLFIATWQSMSFANSTGNATFQAVLVSNGTDASFVMLNYGEIDSTDQNWLAGYETVDGTSNIIAKDIITLSSSSNVQIPGRWAFQVIDPASSYCQKQNCSWDEVCKQINGVYGCGCGENNTMLNKDTYDAIETCSGSSGSLSLSRCQLFEAGYSADVLHLNDPTCKGEIQNNRLVFKFDSNTMCGTILEHNETHIIFKNNAGTTDGMGVISHVSGLNIAFSCLYPLIQSFSMPMAFQISGSTISRELSTEGSYQIHMVPYPDSQFLVPYSGNVTLEMNQQLYIAVEVDQFDSKQITLVLDNCWATPINQMDSLVRWDLIIRECPNPADGTVEVLQNGISTSSRFSFRMFMFTGFSGNSIILHCQVHLCLQGPGNCAQSCNGTLSRRRRSVDFYDS